MAQEVAPRAYTQSSMSAKSEERDAYSVGSSDIVGTSVTRSRGLGLWQKRLGAQKLETQ